MLVQFSAAQNLAATICVPKFVSISICGQKCSMFGSSNCPQYMAVSPIWILLMQILLNSMIFWIRLISPSPSNGNGGLQREKPIILCRPRSWQRVFFSREIFCSSKNRTFCYQSSKGVINMKCTLSLCLVVAVVFILGVGYAATKTPLMEAYTKGYYLYLSTPLTFSPCWQCRGIRG